MTVTLANLRDSLGFLLRGVPARAKPSLGTKNISNNIIGADKVGNWWALQADGTMLSGSALTMTAAGAPGVSPLTFNGSTQYYSSSGVAYPTGDFSVVAVFNAADVSVQSQILADFAINKFLLRIQGSGSAANFTVYNSAGNPAVATSAAISPNTWVGVCGRYVSSTGVANIRIAGVTTSGGNGGTGVNAGSSAMFAAALNAVPQFPFSGSVRGIFFTETNLSDARADAIMAGAL